ncbi:p53 and DNA damage-regulated protein 1 [Toxocara canis]|uniref:p53 and DNA damage-regulated protein 1 n=1 Tax=Toxocara canis TaxID=6265 RepID=A0A0B2V0P2_TOXCA|nr:p53 and DNA damage-regulated protein 1 [Toxocara canis]
MDVDDSSVEHSEVSSSKLVTRLSEYEQLGQSVIMGKRALIELDERRQKCREAARVLRNKAKIQASRFMRNGDKSWVCLGNTTFIKLPTQQTIGLIEEDIKVINATIDSTRDELKKRVDELKEMEGSKDLETLGFKLRLIV